MPERLSALPVAGRRKGPGGGRSSARLPLPVCATVGRGTDANAQADEQQGLRDNPALPHSIAAQETGAHTPQCMQQTTTSCIIMLSQCHNTSHT